MMEGAEHHACGAEAEAEAEEGAWGDEREQRLGTVGPGCAVLGIGAVVASMAVPVPGATQTVAVGTVPVAVGA